MKKMNGFTVAELVIAIGLIGVIGTITLPMLTNAPSKMQAGPTLSKAFNTLENAGVNLLTKKDARTIFEACDRTKNNMYSDRYFSCLNDNNILKTTRIIHSIDGLQGSRPCYKTSDGIFFCEKSAGSHSVGDTTSPFYYGKAIEFVVDTNGTKGPNKKAYDQFRVLIDFYGTPIALGSRAHKEYFSKAKTWEETCNETEVTNKDHCAGAIVDNNWQIKYKL